MLIVVLLPPQVSLSSTSSSLSLFVVIVVRCSSSSLFVVVVVRRRRCSLSSLFVVVVVHHRSQSRVDCQDASNLKRENRTRMLLRRAVVASMSIVSDVQRRFSGLFFHVCSFGIAISRPAIETVATYVCELPLGRNYFSGTELKKYHN